jgi:CheY-like chemotaxis protein
MKPRFETPPKDGRSSSRYRILCVDDNSAFLMALRLSLSASGFEVVTAVHGVDALMQYKAYSGDFEAIVTDHDMPQMNGSEFIRSIREMGFKGRIVLMSGNLSPQSLMKLQDCQISGFFTKPFEIGMLAALLSQGL